MVVFLSMVLRVDARHLQPLPLVVMRRFISDKRSCSGVDMLTPNREETILILISLIWGLFLGPAVLALTILIGISRDHAVPLVGLYFLGFAPGIVGLAKHFRRAMREMGVGNFVVYLLWVLLVVLLSLGLRKVLGF